MVFAETKLQPVSKEERTDVENFTLINFNASFDAVALRQNVKKSDEYKRVLDNNRDEIIPVHGSAQETVRSRNSSSTSGAVSYRKDNLSVSWKQMAMSTSQDTVFSL